MRMCENTSFFYYLVGHSKLHTVSSPERTSENVLLQFLLFLASESVAFGTLPPTQVEVRITVHLQDNVLVQLKLLGSSEVQYMYIFFLN